MDTSASSSNVLLSLISQFQDILKEHYRNEENNCIIHLFSGKRVPLKEYYINLNIVEKKTKRNEDKVESRKIEIPEDLYDDSIPPFETLYSADHSKSITSDNLFRPQATSDNNSSSEEEIKKVLVLGRAGIGKSTFCRYLANQWAVGEFSKEASWSQFELVIYIPLGKLAHYAENLEGETKPSIAGFIYHQVALQEKLKESGFNKQTIEELLNVQKEKTLYLLDGYDEVGNLGKEHPIWSVVDILKSMPRWIITSRPCYLKDMPSSIDRKMEIMGFGEGDIHRYISAYFEVGSDKGSVKEQSDQLLAHLQKNRAIWGIVHIPIQLELICYVWGKGYENYKDKDLKLEQLTMTGLYHYLELHLLKDYLKRRGVIEKHILPGSQDENKIINLAQMPFFLTKMRSALAAIAFCGLERNQPLLSHSTVKSCCDQYEVETVMAIETGFMKCSDEISCLADREGYYFPHLTFQEYYAAIHIVEIFLSRRETSGKLINGQHVETFIQQHKYDRKYEIVFWFVVGLLAKKGENFAKDFFDLFETSPRDALGLRHAIISIRLLEECLTEDGKIALPASYYQNLWEVVAQYANSIALNGAQKEDIFYTASYPLIQNLALSPRLLHKENLLGSLLNPLLEGKYKTMNFCNRLGTADALLPDTLINALVAQFEHRDFSIRFTAVTTLGNQSNLPEQAVHALITHLGHSNWVDRRMAADALGNQPNLPVQAIHALVHHLDDSAFMVVFSAQNALAKQVHSFERNLPALVDELAHPEENIRNLAKSALFIQSTLPEQILSAIVDKLDHPGKEVRNAALCALRNKSDLPEKVFSTLVDKLDHPEEYIRSSVGLILAEQPNPPEKALFMLIDNLGHSEKDVRKKAMDALASQSYLPEKIINAIGDKLDHPEKEVRNAVLYVLRDKGNLPEKAFSVLVDKLDHPEEHIRNSLGFVLAQQPNPPEKALFLLIDQLEHPEEDVRKKAIEALAKQSYLPEKVIDAIADKLDHPEWYVRQSAIDILDKRPSLSSKAEKILSTLVDKLEHSEENAQSKAINILNRCLHLPEKIFNAIVDKLDHPEASIRLAALCSLAAYHCLPEKAINALINNLANPDEEVRFVATGTLASQYSLPEQAMVALLDSLDRMEFRLRILLTYPWARGTQHPLPARALYILVDGLTYQWDAEMNSMAAKALAKQPYLPEKILHAIMDKPESILWIDDILVKQPYLSENIINAIMDKLGKEYRSISANLLRLNTTPSQFLGYIGKRCTNEGDKKKYFTYFLQVHGITPIYLDSKEGLPIEKENIPLFEQALKDFKQSYQLESIQEATSLEQVEKCPLTSFGRGGIGFFNNTVPGHGSHSFDSGPSETDQNNQICAVM
jgi:HEAT repeat protein